MKNLATIIIMTIVLGFTVNGFSQDSTIPTATENAYFDMATGHKYIKNSDNTYTEYNRKGELFKTNVPATQPHLSASRFMAPVSEESYVLYKKYSNYTPVFEALKANQSHPAGTYATRVLSSARELIKEGIEVGYAASLSSIDQNKEQRMADKAAYIDIVTGHKYIKNADNIYTEYTRKGELFKTNVSAVQPHLSSSRYVKPITQGDFLVYSKYENNKAVTRVLASETPHPEDWKCEGMLVSIDQPGQPNVLNNDSLLAVQTAQ